MGRCVYGVLGNNGSMDAFSIKYQFSVNSILMQSHIIHDINPNQ